MTRNRYGLFRFRWIEVANLPTLAEAMAICRAWNAAHPVGQPVHVARAAGKGLKTTTRRRAAVHEGRCVLWVEGATGYVELQHVRAI